jgi:predicted nuclease of predicted toxin-antitoxin system
MKLLFDQNLSPRLVERLTDIFPDSTHVSLKGLDRAMDDVVWKWAREYGFTIVTKDADFNELSTLRGFPPKIIWIRAGNRTTAQIERLIRVHYKAIQQMHEDPTAGILLLK